MRPSPLLRQIAANAASAQRKLPLPTIYPSAAVPRLKPPHAEWLPSLVNAPTTLPPSFITPKQVNKKEMWAVAKQVYHKAKSYYAFYKAGMQQFNTNRKIRRFLKRELMKQFTHIQIPGSATIVMSRSEFQMCIRTKQDWRKMPCT
jgi:hypothetical protein